jgi:hypothetical protein
MRETTRVWLLRGVLATAVWLAICALTFAQGLQPRPVLVALAVLAACSVLWLLLDLSVSVEPSDWTTPSHDPVRAPGEDRRLALLRRVLTAHLVGREVDEGLHDQLVKIADDRLLARHGVRRAVDPERAATLFGPDLARFADATAPYPRLTPAQIGLLIDRIEAL